MSIRSFLLAKHRLRRSDNDLAQQLDDIAHYASQVEGGVQSDLEAQTGSAQSETEVNELCPLLPIRLGTSDTVKHSPPPLHLPYVLPVLAPANDADANMSLLASIGAAVFLFVWYTCLPDSVKAYFTSHWLAWKWVVHLVMVVVFGFVAYQGDVHTAARRVLELACGVQSMFYSGDPFGVCGCDDSIYTE